MDSSRAGCDGSRTSGSGSGPEKRTSRDAGTALRSDSTHRHRLLSAEPLSLFLFLRDVFVGPADFGRAVPKIAGRFWAEDDADAYEPKGGRVISPTTIAGHASWFRRTKMSGLVLPELDAQRLFSHEQRREIWDRHGGKCGICGQAITSEEEEYDHVIPWISGGRCGFR